MSDENATPAGGGGGEASGPRSEASPQSLTVDAAATLMSQWPDDGQGQPEPTQPAPAGEPEAPRRDADDLEAEGQQFEGDGTPPEGGETHPESVSGYDWEKVPGDARFVLRDGTVVTGADLKRDWDDLRVVRQKAQELTAQEQQHLQRQAQIAQQEQYFQQIAPMAIASIKASLPQVPDMPDPALKDSDPVTYFGQMADRQRAQEDYNAKVRQIQQIQQGQQLAVHRSQAERAEAEKAYLADQQHKLYERMPDLRDEAKRKAFYNDYLEHGQKYGFTEDELVKAYDHRLILLARDAIAYRKLKANPPKPEGRPQGQQAPVARPGRRVSAPEAQSAKRDELFNKARQSGGSMRDIAAIIAELD